jgi:hypothetical protein
LAHYSKKWPKSARIILLLLQTLHTNNKRRFALHRLIAPGIGWNYLGTRSTAVESYEMNKKWWQLSLLVVVLQQKKTLSLLMKCGMAFCSAVPPCSWGLLHTVPVLYYCHYCIIHKTRSHIFCSIPWSQSLAAAQQRSNKTEPNNSRRKESG